MSHNLVRVITTVSSAGSTTIPSGAMAIFARADTGTTDINGANLDASVSSGAVLNLPTLGVARFPAITYTVASGGQATVVVIRE